MAAPGRIGMAKERNTHKSLEKVKQRPMERRNSSRSMSAGACLKQLKSTQKKEHMEDGMEGLENNKAGRRCDIEP